MSRRFAGISSNRRRWRPPPITVMHRQPPLSTHEFSRHTAAAGLVLALAAALVAVGGPAAAGPPSEADAAMTSLAARAQRAGLRVIKSRHLVLVTDRAKRQDDQLEELPAIFDDAFEVWCRHYQLDPDRLAGWQAFGCLVVDRDRFRTAGLLPDAVPDFVNGYCAFHRFWLIDQASPDYRRHLLLHEGVHAFTTTVRRLDTPPWYTEGIAEWLATHRLVAATPRFRQTPIPTAASDVERLGRIETIQRLRESHDAPSLDAVFRLQPTLHGTITSYASAWAAVAFLEGHPRYAAAFAAAEQGPLDAGFTDRLTSRPDFDIASARRDFDAFTADLDYGYAFEPMTVDWSAGRPLAGDSQSSTAPRTFVRPDRGWQNTGWELRSGQTYRLAVAGRCVIGRLDAGDQSRTLESGADGISLDWYRGRPVGRLLAAQWDEQPADGGRSRFHLVGEGGETTITAITTGPLFLRINNAPANFPACRGRLDVVIHGDTATTSPKPREPTIDRAADGKSS